MTAPLQRKAASHATLLWLVPAIALALLAWYLPPDGKDNSTFAHFLGRFHPLVLHLPIGFMVLLAAFEVLGRLPRLAHVRAATPFVLGANVVVALLATVLGYLLAWGGAYEGELLMRHLWGGILLCAVSALLAWSYGRGLLHGALLLAALLTMSLVAHDGGSLTHGETFLTQHMPQSLRSLLGLPESAPKQPKAKAKTESRKTEPTTSPQASQPTNGDTGGTKTNVVATAGTFGDKPTYEAVLAPIFDKKCMSCHKASKKKGELLMETYEALLEGGDTGPALVPGDLEKSELWRRITLPPDHDEYMPSDGKPALTKAEVEIVKAWILAGAPKQ